MKKDYQARLEEISARDRSIWASGMFFAGMDEMPQARRTDGMFQGPVDRVFTGLGDRNFIGLQYGSNMDKSDFSGTHTSCVRVPILKDSSILGCLLD